MPIGCTAWKVVRAGQWVAVERPTSALRAFSAASAPPTPWRLDDDDDHPSSSRAGYLQARLPAVLRIGQVPFTAPALEPLSPWLVAGPASGARTFAVDDPFEGVYIRDDAINAAPRVYVPYRPPAPSREEATIDSSTQIVFIAGDELVIRVDTGSPIALQPLQRS